MVHTEGMAAWDAVLLAGGAGRRLGTIDKPAITIRGRTLLDTAIAACAAGRTIVVVGPRRPTSHPVRWTRERPPGAGPLAALGAGLHTLGSGGSGVVVVLAADLPAVLPDTVTDLIAAASADGVDGAVAIDRAGRQQPLLAAYRRPALDRALAGLGDPRDRAFRDLLANLRLAPVDVADAADDIDTTADLRRWQEGEQ